VAIVIPKIDLCSNPDILQYRETNLRSSSKMETEETSLLKDQVFARERNIRKVADLAEAAQGCQIFLGA
jgi:hypothetical protein